MIPELWNELGTEKIGDLNDCLECFVEEERNGIFELTLDYPNGYPLADQLLKEKIIVVNANDTLLNQKFRIYDTKKFIDETITVFARHISFDLMYDYVGDVTFENQSCEYALNSLFRQSQFSKHYRGYSDIVNAQNYSMSMCNILEAIGGKEGSIIDTFGTGAEILRDNTDIHVLNSRGHDNGVTIEYAKNLTGFELEEDTTDLVTRILPYAKYTPEGGNETLIKGSFVDSPLIHSYSHPYIKHIDYTYKFKDKEIPTKEKLETLARNEYRDNKVDIPKTNFKIEFIPLSKCVGYEELEDKISICDKVTIKNTRYNVDTKSKVIKCKFDVLKDRYESMELGEPRTTFGDIIGGGKGEGQVGPPGPQGPPGADGSIGDFPNSLPQTPILTAKVYGFATIELSWTYEDKVYYTYELYASKTKDFTPNTFDLIHEGQTSSFLFQAKPNETWYFRVCAKNTHGNRTEFSPQVAAITNKVDDFDEYFSSLAVGNLVANIFSADYMEAGIIKGHWIDAKHLTVTDGNGKRTLDIDDFGNITLMPSVFKMLIDGQEQDVATKNMLTITEDNLKSQITKIEKNYVTQTEFVQSSKDFEFKFYENTSPNLMFNGGFEKQETYNRNHPFVLDYTKGGGDTGYPPTIDGGQALLLFTNGGDSYFEKPTTIKIKPNTEYIISYYYCCSHGRDGSNYIFVNNNPIRLNIKYIGDRAWHRASHVVNIGSNVDAINKIRLGIIAQEQCWILFDNMQIEEKVGDNNTPSKYRPNSNEVCVNNSFIDKEGMGVKHKDGSYTKMIAEGFRRYVGSTGYSYHYLTYIGKTQKLNLNPVSIQLPNEFKGKDFKVTLSLEEVANPAGWLIQSVQLLVGAIDKVNGRFEILGGSQSQYFDGTQGTMKPTTISYTVTA